MSVIAVNSITDAAGGNTATINGTTPTADSLQGFRNRLINSDMRIDQRNNGAAVTVNADASFYAVDRFVCFGQGSDGIFTAQQVTDAPTGFSNSLKLTTTTADASIGTTQTYLTGHMIEGFNTADLMWGTANAKTVTLSFWVKSSLTGTFGGALLNSAQSYSYPFSYTISAANTWEQKTITVAGPTAGTWIGATNGIGVRVFFGFGVGSDYKNTAGSWVATREFSSTGSVDLISTLSATWQITGVQLEAGSVATPFERRPYGTELALCQRYYYKNTASGSNRVQIDQYVTSGIFPVLNLSHPVEMRALPTVTQNGSWDSSNLNIATLNFTANTLTLRAQIDANGTGRGYAYPNNGNGFSVSAEL